MNEKVQSGPLAFFKEVLRAAIISLLICVILVLLFALAIKLFQISADTIPAVSQIIKFVSVAAGVFIAANRPSGFFKGMATAAIYSVAAVLLFMLLGGKFEFGRFAIDLAIAVAVAAAAGAIGSAIKA